MTKKASTSTHEAFEKGFRAGAIAEKERIQIETLRWLRVTGCIPRGSSYFSELVDGILKTPVLLTSEIMADRWPEEEDG